MSGAESSTNTVFTAPPHPPTTVNDGVAWAESMMKGAHNPMSAKHTCLVAFSRVVIASPVPHGFPLAIARQARYALIALPEMRQQDREVRQANAAVAVDVRVAAVRHAAEPAEQRRQVTQRHAAVEVQVAWREHAVQPDDGQA